MAVSSTRVAQVAGRSAAKAGAATSPATRTGARARPSRRRMGFGTAPRTIPHAKTFPGEAHSDAGSRALAFRLELPLGLLVGPLDGRGRETDVESSLLVGIVAGQLLAKLRQVHPLARPLQIQTLI